MNQETRTVLEFARDKLLTDKATLNGSIALTVEEIHKAIDTAVSNGWLEWIGPTRNAAGKVEIPGYWAPTSTGRVLLT
jgi:hypothetical protein